MHRGTKGPVLLSLLLLSSLAGTAAGREDLEEEFFRDLDSMEREYRDFEKTAFEAFQKDVEAMWGDFVASTRKDWVEYSEDRKARTRVDFKEGEVLVEVLLPRAEADRNPAAASERITSEIQALVAHKGKNRDYSLPPAGPGQPERPPQPLLTEPVLKDQLRDASGKTVTPENGEAFAREVIRSNPVTQETLQTALGPVVKAQVRFRLVPEHLRIRASRYLEIVRANSTRFAVSVPLVFAVMHTESFFNPKATSPVPAHGLMQVVPKTGGRDAYKYVYGKDRIPSADYLYQPEKNVELGCAYLRLLSERYFGAVRNPENALYIAIASYNTGPGNLASALCGAPLLDRAAAEANKMAPAALYQFLLQHLPVEETRQYLRNVSERISLYQDWR